MKKLIDVLDCAWVDPVTTRQLRVLKMDTTAWPISQLRWDVLLTRPDGWSTSTNTIYLAVERGETQ